jgi:hypothetical protein
VIFTLRVPSSAKAQQMIEYVYRTHRCRPVSRNMVPSMQSETFGKEKAGVDSIGGEDHCGTHREHHQCLTPRSSSLTSQKKTRRPAQPPQPAQSSNSRQSYYLLTFSSIASSAVRFISRPTERSSIAKESPIRPRLDQPVISFVAN